MPRKRLDAKLEEPGIGFGELIFIAQALDYVMNAMISQTQVVILNSMTTKV